MLGSATNGAAPWLIVGAGLTGISLAWLAVHAGRPAILVANERPVSGDAALATAIVHALGPPADPFVWARMSQREHERVARRARAGHAILRRALLASARPIGLRATAYLLHTHIALGAEILAAAHARLRAAGFPVEIRDVDGHGVFVRDDDAVVSPRHLALTMLRQARARGLVVRIPETVTGVAVRGDGAVRVHFSGGEGVFERVLWTGPRPWRDDPGTATFRRRVVLQHRMDEGAHALPAFLEVPGGEASFAPDPAREGRTVLIRCAGDAAGMGLAFAEPPPAWRSYRGASRRQTISETLVGPVRRTFSARASVVSLCGLANWPVTSVLGACAEVVGAEF